MRAILLALLGFNLLVSAVHGQSAPERALVDLANQSRAEHNLKPLAWDAALARAAQANAKFLPREDLVAPDLAALLALDDAAFRQLFSGSPIKRIGRDRFVRNCLYAAGNSGSAALLPQAEALAADPDPVVADAARWAAARLRACP